MSASENKQLMQDIFSELSKGNGQAFVEALADDIQWTWMGTVKWSQNLQWKGSRYQRAIESGNVYAYRAILQVFCTALIAEGDYVVVESRGENALRDGRSYNNKYCWVCRFAEGKLQELHEYMDTELVTVTFRTDDKV